MSVTDSYNSDCAGAFTNKDSAGQRYAPHDHFNYFGSRNHKPFDMSEKNTTSCTLGGNLQSPDGKTGSDSFYKSVSSSVTSSVDKDGKVQSERTTETTVNDNGKVTKFSTHT
ncbi:unnamed protein product [Parnassius apollo]|uniref:(apollo) hypothetical protein n=1 Tax=Parnassius apollo TaxID=110799 RepID=A0A8S3WTH1_PARAO|nr:unnamed protein product [Parnassius apollo]